MNANTPQQASLPGAALKQKYQQAWNIVHFNTSVITARAANADQVLNQLAKQSDHLHNVWLECKAEISTVASVKAAMVKITTQLHDIEKGVDELERLLSDLEHAKREKELYRYKQAQIESLSRFNIAKSNEIAEFERKVRKDFEKAVHEERRREKMERANMANSERQIRLQIELERKRKHEEELKKFAALQQQKQVSQLATLSTSSPEQNRQPIGISAEQQAALASITLDTTKQEAEDLEKFLGSPTSNNADEEETSENILTSASVASASAEIVDKLQEDLEAEKIAKEQLRLENELLKSQLQALLAKTQGLDIHKDSTTTSSTATTTTTTAASSEQQQQQQ